MKKYKINISKFNESVELKLHFPQKARHFGKEKSLEQLAIDEIDNNTNQIIDKEKASFQPNYEKLEFSFKNSDGTNKTLGDLGFSYEDVLFNRNRYNRSFFRISFFDSGNPSQQRFIFDQRIYLQRNEFVYDTNNEVITDISTIPCKVLITSPYTGKYSLNYNLYYKKADIYPKILYAYISFNNAFNGVSTPLISNVSISTIQNINSLNFLKYQLFSNTVSPYYTVDDTNRDISITSGTLKVKLYESPL